MGRWAKVRDVFASALSGLILLAGVSLPAAGQLTSKNNWLFSTQVITNTGTNSGLSASATTYDGSNAVGLAWINATATQQNWGIFESAPQSQFEHVITLKQSFTLGAESVVQVSRFLDGGVSFLGPEPNLSVGLYGASWDIINTATNTTVATWTSNGFHQAVNGVFSLDTVNLSTATLPMGNYRLEARLDINGYTRPTPVDSPAVGSGVWTYFGDGTDKRGITANLEAWPTGLTDSRSAIDAPAARGSYNVTGAGVTVGQIEIGRPYRSNGGNANDPGDWTGAHPSLAGRLSVTNIAEAGKTKYRDEHAQAVASVIASSDANSANAGVAPGATILTAATASYAGNASQSFRSAAGDLFGTAAVRVINMSMTTNNDAAGTDPSGDAAWLNQQLNANPNVTFVKSAGNNGSYVTTPGTASNGITVGGLDNPYGSRRASSSNQNIGNGLYRFKPDLVAPGQFINAASAFGGGFSRGFTGEAFDGTATVTTGAVTGTSFAAPHVAGTAALLYEYYDDHAADHDQNAKVIKAVLLNSADRRVTRNNGGAWSQFTQVGPNNVHQVLLSYDPELGAGMVNARNALIQYAPAEIELADNNADVQYVIDAIGKPLFWDRQTVIATTNEGVYGDQATVDYVLGYGGGDIRSALTWNALDNGTIPKLSMRIYKEGNTIRNPIGWDLDDILVAETLPEVFFGADGFTQNSAIFDFDLPITVEPDLLDFGLPDINGEILLNPFKDRYYLSIYNLDNLNVEYGLAVDFGGVVPEPGSIMVVLVSFTLVISRRRSPMRRSA